MVTEFFNTADPVEVPASFDEYFGLQDTTLKFGKLTMTHGKAFAFNGTNGTMQAVNENTKVPVYKSWVKAEGRKFLIESVPVLNLTEELNALPLQARAETQNLKSAKKPLLAKSGFRNFPPNHEVTVSTNQILLASADFSHEPGVVLDYTTVNDNLGDYTFQAGQTYLVSGYVNMNNLTVQGGP